MFVLRVSLFLTKIAQGERGCKFFSDFLFFSAPIIGRSTPMLSQCVGYESTSPVKAVNRRRSGNAV